MSSVLVFYLCYFSVSLIFFRSVSETVRKTPFWVVIVGSPLATIICSLVMAAILWPKDADGGGFTTVLFMLFIVFLSVPVSVYVVSYLYIKRFAKGT